MSESDLGLPGMMSHERVSISCFSIRLVTHGSHHQPHQWQPTQSGLQTRVQWYFYSNTTFGLPLPTPACFKVNPLHDVHTISVFVLFWVSWLFKGNKRWLARDASRHLVCADWWAWERGACTGRGADDGTGQLFGTGVLALQGPSAPWSHRQERRPSSPSLLLSPHPSSPILEPCFQIGRMIEWGRSAQQRLRAGVILAGCTTGMFPCSNPLQNPPLCPSPCWICVPRSGSARVVGQGAQLRHSSAALHRFGGTRSSPGRLSKLW